MIRQLHHIATEATVADGSTALLIEMEAPADAPEVIREGVARRRAVNRGGTCPCGARWAGPNRAQRRAAARGAGPLYVAVEHEDACPATTPNLERATEAWQRETR